MNDDDSSNDSFKDNFDDSFKDNVKQNDNFLIDVIGYFNNNYANVADSCVYIY